LILKHYINKDIYRATGAILLVLILIFVSTRFVKFIQLAVDGTISAEAVFSLLALQIPAVAGFLLPLSFFLAILITFGRLYSDNELVVIHGLGIGQKDLAKMLMPTALVFALIAGSLSTILTPWAISQSKVLMAEQAAQAKLGIFSAGRFRENSNKDGIVFVESKTDDGTISGVFSVSRTLLDDGEATSQLKIQTAKQGRQWENEETGVNYLVLEQGQVLAREQSIDGEGRPVGFDNSQNQNADLLVQNESRALKDNRVQKGGWQITEFASFYNRIVQDDSIQVKSNIKSTSTIELLNNLGNEQWAALHWRLAAPLSIPLICLLAVPLSRTQPRQGKFARLLPSILIYLIYVLLMMYSRKLIEAGRIPSPLGFWWIHAGLLMFIYWLYRPAKIKRKHKKINQDKASANV